MHYIHKFDISEIDWNGFRSYVFKRYAKSWASTVYSYARKYVELIHNPSIVETFSGSKKNSVLKSLIALSKYCGFYPEFKKKTHDFGIKWHRSSSIDSFFRIMNNANNDVIEWLDEATKVLDVNDLNLYLRFVLMSGLRKSEATNSFNLLVRLHDQKKLSNYYNEKHRTIEHFRYPDIFFRRTKNMFISMIPKHMIYQIIHCNPVTYEMIRKRLHRRRMSVRIRDLRDYYATFMVRHGLIKEEVDLLQGRISKSIFVRHYWSPAISELRERVFKALEELKQTILS